MSNIPRVYRSTDPGAPQLSGQPGRLVEILDAVLVNGYGSGVDEKPPLGWTLAFSGTNKRAYRNNPALHSGHFLRVDDSAAQYAAFLAYETMSDVDTGLRPGGSASAYGKSSAASSQARDWMVAGTAQGFYLMIKPQGTYWKVFFVGDAHPLLEADLGRFIVTRTATSNSFTNDGGLGQPTTASHGAWSTRQIDGQPGSGYLRCHPTLFGSSIVWGSGPYSYPFADHAGILLSRGILRTDGTTDSPPRFVLPGLWIPEHSNLRSYFSHGSILTEVASLPVGTELMFVELQQASTVNAFIDISNEWTP